MTTLPGGLLHHYAALDPAGAAGTQRTLTSITLMQSYCPPPG